MLPRQHGRARRIGASPGSRIYIYIYMYVYVYIYIHKCMYVCICQLGLRSRTFVLSPRMNTMLPKPILEALRRPLYRAAMDCIQNTADTRAQKGSQTGGFLVLLVLCVLGVLWVLWVLKVLWVLGALGVLWVLSGFEWF